MFALDLIALVSEVGWLHPSTLGWMAIAIVWSIIGSLWLAAALSAHRELRNQLLSPTKRAEGVRRHTK